MLALPVAGLTIVKPGLAAAFDEKAVERIDEALENMQRPHELRPMGVDGRGGWHDGPFSAMGTRPYGDAIPNWWRKGIRHKEWRSIATWFTVYVGASGTASLNTGVEVNGIESWALLRSKRQWKQLAARQTPSWQGAYAPDATRSLQRSGGRFLDGGGLLATPQADAMTHGGIPQVELPWTADGADFDALLVSVRHRLRLIDPAGLDDRRFASFCVLAGADYYPWLNARVSDLEADYNPGAGSGRFLKSTSSWRYSTVLLLSERKIANALKDIEPPAFSF